MQKGVEFPNGNSHANNEITGKESCGVGGISGRMSAGIQAVSGRKSETGYVQREASTSTVGTEHGYDGLPEEGRLSG